MLIPIQGLGWMKVSPAIGGAGVGHNVIYFGKITLLLLGTPPQRLGQFTYVNSFHVHIFGMGAKTHTDNKNKQTTSKQIKKHKHKTKNTQNNFLIFYIRYWP